MSVCILGRWCSGNLFCVVVIHCPGWQHTHKGIPCDVCHDTVTGEWSLAYAAESIATGCRTFRPFRSSSTSYKAVCTQSANAFMAEASGSQLLLILPRICSWWTPSYHQHSKEPLQYHITELCRWQLSRHVYHLCTSHTRAASLEQLRPICMLVMY